MVMETLKRDPSPVRAVRAITRGMTVVEDNNDIEENCNSKQQIANAFPNATNIVVFRDKIYKVLRKSYIHTVNWYIYEYFSAPESIDDNKEFVYMMDCCDKTLKGWGCAQTEISYDAFTTEAKIIEESEIPTKLHECILNIQQRKVVATIPHKKILEHELHHLQALRTEIAAHVEGMMKYVYDVLDKSKMPVGRIEYSFIAYEHKIKNGCKIYYDYPNSDGQMRPTFYLYFNYLFNKLYPKPAATEADIATLDDVAWAQYTIFQMLCAKYPFMTIEYVGAPHYVDIHLPIAKILH
jgi:hypothetical protein